MATRLRAPSFSGSIILGMAFLLILNYFIFTAVLDRPSASGLEGGGSIGDLVERILDIQLERKDARIKDLEKQIEARGCTPVGREAGGSLGPVPKQVLTVGWEWKTRETRRLRFWDSGEVSVYRTTYPGSMANPLTPNVDWWDRVEVRGWEIDTFFVIYTFLNSESSYIDFGAWIGPTLLYGATRAKRAFGLEPDPYAYDELRANLALNPRLQDHTWIYWKCIMDKPGIYPMGGGGGDSMGMVGQGNHAKSWMVDCTTLPQFIEEHQIENLDLIKIDPEGAEHIILPSFKSWLRNQKKKPTLWLSIHKWNWAPGSEASVMDVLRLYKRVLEGHDKEVNMATYVLCDFCTILATDTDLQVYYE